jgi:hypothetical protein
VVTLLQAQRHIGSSAAIPICQPLLQYWIATEFIAPYVFGNIVKVDIVVDKQIAGCLPPTGPEILPRLNWPRFPSTLRRSIEGIPDYHL